MPIATILVLDPDLDARVILRTALERAGHRVLLAADAESALSVARGAALDGIVSELHVMASPTRSAVRMLRAGQRAAPAVLGYTAYAAESDLEWASLQGYDLVLPKPTGLTTILEAVDRLLAARAAARRVETTKPREPSARGAVHPPSMDAAPVRASRSLRQRLPGWGAR